MLKKVLSGAQTGVDQAALCAAKDCGLNTGGDVPPRCRTEVGEMPQLIAEFNLTEITTVSYASRTESNVRQADAVLILAWKENSPGTLLTKRLAKKYGVPWYGLYWPVAGAGEKIVEWLNSSRPETLMVAGNRESVAPGIGEWAEGLLHEVFAACRRAEDA